MKGRGREIIQLGQPIADAPLEDEKGGFQKSCGSCKKHLRLWWPEFIILSSLGCLSFLLFICELFSDRRMETIPALLQEVTERIVGMNIMTMKPNSCIIDFYNEVTLYFFSSLKFWAPKYAWMIQEFSSQSIGRSFSAMLMAILVWTSYLLAVLNRMRFDFWKSHCNRESWEF